MALIRRFKDFLLRNSIQNQDYVVGYDGNNGEEIRIKASTFRGADGSSADIQFSADRETWHYPIAEGDLYIRIRVGAGEWNVARFVADAFEQQVGTLSTLPTSQPTVNEESLSGNIILHAIAKTGSYQSLLDKPRRLTDIQTHIEASDVNSLSSNMHYYTEEAASSMNFYVLAFNRDNMQACVLDFDNIIDVIRENL